MSVLPAIGQRKDSKPAEMGKAIFGSKPTIFGLLITILPISQTEQAETPIHGLPHRTKDKRLFFTDKRYEFSRLPFRAKSGCAIASFRIESEVPQWSG